MKKSTTFISALLIAATCCGAFAFSRSMNVLYCARPVEQGPGACTLGIDNLEDSVLKPHYTYIATEKDCPLACDATMGIHKMSLTAIK
ncbi:hypothetical protein [Filimonas effusa]|uniref:Uncharacterized protein n=1 Tax=Filimonas effusa TaxID=2508721 RepID=A0A4Q1D1L6_9BACT|nr:hypothetical protein [Filimonas effusa]RXK81746.1 hypothetical protein ESB13_18305 [Filimonas effusa]